MDFKFIKYNVEERLGYITLNRPEKRNALNAEMVAELTSAFSKAESDPEVKIIILNAEGESFSAGADLEYLKQLQQNSFEENHADSQQLMKLFQKIYSLNKIVVAQIEGHAIAGGCGLATVCDFSFAVPEAKFGYTEVKIGFVPAIVMVFLIRKIGEGKAKELLFSGDLIEAQQAKEIGLINDIEFGPEIKQRVKSFALKLAKNASADSLRLTKQMIGRVQDLEYPQALEYAAKMNAEARATADCKRGIDAFLNKKDLTW